MNELLAHIEAMNAETRAWIAAGPERWATEFHTDMLTWAASGIHTVEDFNKMLDAECERENRKEAMYYDDFEYYDSYNEYKYCDNLNDDGEEMNAADDSYFNSFDEWYNIKYNIEEDNAYEEWYAENQMKKYGVDTIIMIPTHYEFMANQAGYLEY